MYYRSRFEDHLGLLGAVVGVLGCCLVFLGLVLPGGGMSVALPAQHRAAQATASDVAPAAGSKAHVVVPRLGIDAEVRPIALGPGDVLTPPDDPRLLGWWDRSAPPGELGRTVITGHTVHTGGGVLDDLGSIDEGDEISVSVARASATYRVLSVETVTADEVAERSVELFSQDRRSNSLLLVTCSGWTGTRFTHNVLVTAEPVDRRV